MDRVTFERLVAEVLDELPPAFQEKLDNVDVVIEDWPSHETLRRAGARHPAHLMGFYQGVPQTKRSRRYGLVLPDKIILFRGPIERHARTERDVQRLIRRVLRHEIGHHFGLDDDRLRDIGAY